MFKRNDIQVIVMWRKKRFLEMAMQGHLGDDCLRMTGREQWIATVQVKDDQAMGYRFCLRNNERVARDIIVSMIIW